MKQFSYTITDPKGLYARPAGLLNMAAMKMDSTVTLTKADGSCPGRAKSLISLVGMGVKAGETVTVTVEGGNEEANAAAMEQLFKDNL